MLEPVLQNGLQRYGKRAFQQIFCHFFEMTQKTLKILEKSAVSVKRQIQRKRDIMLRTRMTRITQIYAD
jgi:hypothetical protein